MLSTAHCYVVNYVSEGKTSYFSFSTKNTGEALYNELITLLKANSNNNFTSFNITDLGPNDDAVEEDASNTNPAQLDFLAELYSSFAN